MLIKFADDTILIFGNKNVDQLQKRSNVALRDIDEWIKNNRLFINYSKTTYFVTRAKLKSTLLTLFNFKLGEYALNKKDNLKCPGVFIDKDFKYRTYVLTRVKSLQMQL